MHQTAEHPAYIKNTRTVGIRVHSTVLGTLESISTRYRKFNVRECITSKFLYDLVGSVTYFGRTCTGIS